MPHLEELAQHYDGAKITGHFQDDLWRFRSTPKRLISDMLRGVIPSTVSYERYSFTLVTEDSGSIRLRVDVRRENSRTFELGIFHINFIFEGSVLHALRIDAKGRCNGKMLFRNLLKIQGVMQVIELTAKEVGSYAWIRYGFLPTRDSWKELRNKIEKTFNQLTKNYESVRQYKDEVKSILRNNDPKAIRSIPKLVMPVGIPKPKLKSVGITKDTLGFHLMNNNTWKGYLDLRDSNQVGYTRNYVGTGAATSYAGTPAANAATGSSTEAATTSN